MPYFRHAPPPAPHLASKQQVVLLTKLVVGTTPNLAQRLALQTILHLAFRLQTVLYLMFHPLTHLAPWQQMTQNLS